MAPMDPSVVVAAMSEAAAGFLESLDAEGRSLAAMAFPSDDERRQWFYTPTDHGGLRLEAMTAAQQQACLRLVASGLSDAGYLTAVNVMALENVLDRVEGWRLRRGQRFRNPLAYSATVFGQPGGDSWGWRFGGHHVSLSVTVVDGEVASTPGFFGADPAASPGFDGVSYRPLGAAEDHARALVTMLDDEQRDVAVVASVPPLDIVMGNRPRVVDGALPLGLWEIFRGEPMIDVDRLRAAQDAEAERLGLRDEHLEAVRFRAAEGKGLAAAEMTQEQRAQLERLVRHYRGRVACPPDADLDGLHFAWAGALDVGAPHYYRVQGPRLLIEYDNVQRGANHAHSVWRDPENDFGDDLLSRHYSRHH